MIIEQRLNQVAERYKAQGYKVVVQPGPKDLPEFGRDFHVDMVAIKDDGSALVLAKNSPSELQADPNVTRYADIINKQHGWRFDIYVLGPDQQAYSEKFGAKEPPETAIISALDDAERMLQAKFVVQSFIAAWSALESAMRHRLRIEGSQAGWGTSPRTVLNELFSAGVLNNSSFRELEDMFQLRNVIVHGFSPPDIPASAVQLLVETARRLLTESKPAKQPA